MMNNRFFKSFILILSLVFILFIFVGCGRNKSKKNNETYKEEYCEVLFDSNGGSNIVSQQVLKGEKVTKPDTPTKEGFTFDGWYYKGEKWSFIGYVVTENMTLTANWLINSYNLTINTNLASGGTICGGGTYEFNQKVTIDISANPGYTFLGLYNGDKLITDKTPYEFNMPASNLTYNAKFIVNDKTKYVVNHYLQLIDETYPLTPTDTETLYGTTDTLTNAKAKTYEGFITPNVTQTNINGNCNTQINLYYERLSYDLELSINNDKAGSITDVSGKYKYGKEVTIDVTTNPGYTFLGFYDDKTCIYDKTSYTFKIPASNLKYEARFMANTNTKYKVEHYLQNIDDDNYQVTPSDTDTLYGETDTETNAKAKTYEGFKTPTVIQKTINGDGSTVIKLYYERNSYYLSLNINNDNAGIINNVTGNYKYGKEITINVTTNPGYTFNGIYDGITPVYDKQPYTFTMPASNLSYMAKFSANTNTKYKIEHYLQNLDDESYPDIPYDTLIKFGTTDTLTNVETTEYEGFITPNVTQSNINGNGSTVIKLYYERNSYDITLTISDSNAGTIKTNSGSFKYEKEIEIEVESNEGYTFIGWYIDDEEISTIEKFNYKVKSSVTLKALYTINKYKITLNNKASSVTISGIVSGSNYEYNKEITLTASNVNSNYTFKWERNDGIISYGTTYTFNVPASDLTITTNIRAYKRVQNKIYFGTYPQTLVEASSENGLLQYNTYDLTWTSYNYYVEGSVSDCMMYKDIDINNDNQYDYRGVYINKYKPLIYTLESNKDQTYQDENKYELNKIYWFRYDPIEWDILEENDGKLLIIANIILDIQTYYRGDEVEPFLHNGGTGYINNYELSDIRIWLNDTFYNSAFNDLQKSLIEKTVVDNSAKSYGLNSNYYSSENTYDRIFLLSKNEVLDYYETNTDRQAFASDYTKAQGIYCDSNNLCSPWLLRSPVWCKYENCETVSSSGSLYEVGSYVGGSQGIRPVLTIVL